MRRLPLAALICALAVSGLAACGGGNDNNSNSTASTATTSTTDTTTTGAAGGAAEKVQVEADPSGALKFVQSKLTAKPGKATFTFVNSSSTPHDFVLESGGKELAKTDVISQSKATTSATLAAGDYTYFCSVPGHRQAGMEGTLTVK